MIIKAHNECDIKDDIVISKEKISHEFLTKIMKELLVYYHSYTKWITKEFLFWYICEKNNEINQLTNVISNIV